MDTSQLENNNETNHDVLDYDGFYPDEGNPPNDSSEDEDESMNMMGIDEDPELRSPHNGPLVDETDSLLTLGTWDPTLQRHVHHSAFKLRYGNDNVILSLSLHFPISPITLKTVLASHATLQHAYFHSGIVGNHNHNKRLKFYQTMELPTLISITFDLPQGQGESEIPPEFIRLLILLKEVKYRDLRTLRVICPPQIAPALQLPSVFIPGPLGEPESSNPLVEFVRRNQDLLKTLVVGPKLEEMIVKMKRMQFHMVPHVEAFISFPEVALSPFYSSMMLRGQNHLKRLKVTINLEEVWHDVTEAVKNSKDTLELLDLTFQATEETPLIIDLMELKGTGTKEFHIQYKDCTVIGWGFIPGSIKSFGFHGGLISAGDVELLTQAVENENNLEEVTLSITERMKEFKGYVSGSGTNISTSTGLDVAKHPLFDLVKDGPSTLKSFRVECDNPEMELDLTNLLKWLEEEGGEYFTLEDGQSGITLKRKEANNTGRHDHDCDYEEDEKHRPSSYLTSGILNCFGYFP